jgi:lysophospholipase L1-like esterase
LIEAHAGVPEVVNVAGLIPAVLVGLLLVLLSAAVWLRLLFRMQRADFWEYQIRAFEKFDRLQPPKAGAILFTGSSSIRLWRTLDQDMAPLRVLNRGFGGCHLAHVNHYAERIVLPCRPQAVVLYAGENDIGWPSKKTPENVLQDFTRFVSLVQTGNPRARIYFISIKLSPFRRSRWDAMKRANRLIEESARNQKGVRFIDTTSAMLDAEGNPCAKYQPWYRLHMTGQGYVLWASIIKPVLEGDVVEQTRG